MASRRKSALSRTSIVNGTPIEEDESDPYSFSFNPSTFKVVQLRSLLVQHDVVVPSTARKADLIQAYEDEIRPRLEELRAARNRDRNIRPKVEEDVMYTGSSDKDAESSGNESETKLHPHSVLSHRGNHRAGRRSVSWAEDVSGPEDEEELNGDVSTFSLNNPFQSPRHTSDIKPNNKTARKSEPALKRQSPDNNGKRPRASASSIMRDYMDPDIASSISPRNIGSTASKIKDKLSGHGRVKQSEEGDDDDESSGMEADTSRDAYDDPPSSPLSQKRRQRGQRGSSKLSRYNGVDEDEGGKVQKARSVIWLATTSLAILWWIWYSSESRVVGFCDMNRQSNALLDERAREYNIAQQAIKQGDEKANVSLRLPSFLHPGCVPCPAHGRCQSGVVIGCESSDYVLQTPVFAHLPLVDKLSPLSVTAPHCRPDEHKLLLAADLADELDGRLRAFKGHVQCKRLPARFGSLKGVKDWDSNIVYSLPKDELYKELQKEVESGNALTDQPADYFEELWNLALEDLHLTNRVGEEYRGQPTLFTKRGGTGVGLQCRCRLFVESAWQRIRLYLALFAALLATIQWLRHRLQTGRIRQGQTKELYASTLNRLEEFKRNSLQEDGKNQEGFLSISQLRDDILRHESSEKVKKRIWSTVAKMVESNTNVRTRQAKVKGEWSRVWEWVGTVKQGAERSKYRPKEEAVNMTSDRLGNIEV